MPFQSCFPLHNFPAPAPTHVIQTAGTLQQEQQRAHPKHSHRCYLRRELGLREVGVDRCCCPNRGVPKAPPGEGATVPNRPPGEAAGAPAGSGDAPNMALALPACEGGE